MGANTVITGRATDSALFLAPVMHKLGWAPDDWDHLARGIMVGHLLECGGQGAGGNYQYDWRSVPRMDELGFPIAEISDNEFFVTKAPDCGGIICPQSVKDVYKRQALFRNGSFSPDQLERGICMLILVLQRGAELFQLGNRCVDICGRNDDRCTGIGGDHVGFRSGGDGGQFKGRCV